MKVCSYCGRENDLELAGCGECGTVLPESESVPVEVKPAPKVVCPACGAPDNYKAGMALHGSFSWAALFLGGFLAVFFHNASREKRVQCN
ncbi:MAG: Double zinc ribbon, partial [Verrucomicrobiales bacterium]|nr:Double zinc ribbon [Verrucomicrobiales bacterium]